MRIAQFKIAAEPKQVAGQPHVPFFTQLLAKLWAWVLMGKDGEGHRNILNFVHEENYECDHLYRVQHLDN